MNQIEFQGRSFAGASVANYGVVEGGDVVYTKSPLKSNPYGIIKTNKGKTGIVSTLYAVYKPKNNVGAEFVQIYFELDSRMNSYMHPLVNKGAKNDMKVSDENALKGSVIFPKIDEQKAISKYFAQLDHLITLHQRKCYRFIDIALDAWEQRKLGELGSLKNGMNFSKDAMGHGFHFVNLQNIFGNNVVNVNALGLADATEKQLLEYTLIEGDVLFVRSSVKLEGVGEAALVPESLENTTYSGFIIRFRDEYGLNNDFKKYIFGTQKVRNQIMSQATNSANKNISQGVLENLTFEVPSFDEQAKIGEFFTNLDYLITLHQHKLFCAKNVMKYITTDINTPKKEAIMAELESVIEQKLIEQLIYGDSQWTYREDLKTEADLWKNFRYILEQNNKERLNGEPLSDAEFEQVKNQLQFSSFYKAGEWLVGENGKVMVHVQRDTERLHLVVMNHEHIAGGSSVYEVINQYNALKMDEDSSVNARDRRFDVTLMINGLPMIHIELKNKQHSYMDGFWQIKKYIGEGKFTGIFSAVQMFVISNGVDTKYFSAASDTELNPKFISGWLDKENNAVSDYLVFAKSVLRIPEAHEMIARYTVLDEEAKRLILLRPYQIHAIEAIRDASKTGKSGFVWHTTGSGKTLTSYKATRNLLMDIPAIDKAIFLIDRKDLDTQTTMAFQAYANNDLIDVDETDNVFDLKKKLKSDDRQVIVTTIQKLQRLITRKLQEGTPEYHKIKNLKIAFVVDECHRAVTPGTKREIERFFGNSLWYGFTGTPRFAENPYPQMGDLPRTTQELYGDCLHKYTIQNAIHDNAVLGFQVEHNGPKNKKDETDSNLYVTESHMLKVLEVILNKSYYKLGFQNGKGKTYEGLLTTSSIQLAQK